MLVDCISGKVCSHLRGMGRRQGLSLSPNPAVTSCTQTLVSSRAPFQVFPRVSDSDVLAFQNTGNPVIKCQVNSMKNLQVRIIHGNPIPVPTWAKSERNLSLPGLPLLSTEPNAHTCIHPQLRAGSTSYTSDCHLPPNGLHSWPHRMSWAPLHTLASIGHVFTHCTPHPFSMWSVLRFN